MTDNHINYLDALEALLKGHDWYYKFSDDSRWYYQGAEAWRAISLLLDMTGEDGRQLLLKYQPKNVPQF